MKFQINVYGTPWSGNSAFDACDFITEAIAAGHRVQRVFFFFDGVYHGLRSQAPASDEPDVLNAWKTIADAGVELLLCIAASANRGLLNKTEAERYDKDIATVDDIFQVTGLGQWASGFHDCDRMIEFR